MAKFEVGDVVICIDTSVYIQNANQPPLRLGAEYIVQAIRECKCGATTLDVGLPTKMGKTRCCECLSVVDSGKIHWCSSKRFRKKDQKSIEQKIAEAVAKEDYRAAHELQQQLN